MSQSETATDGAQKPADIHVETGGDLFRSVTALLDVLVDECRVRFDADDEEKPEVVLGGVDPANVGMVTVRIPAGAFEVYEVPETTTVGLDFHELTSITDYARKGGNSRDNPGDPVVLEKVDERIYVRVLPEDKWNRTGSFFEIPPQSIRERNDPPTLDLPWSGKVEADRFRDALQAVDNRSFGHVTLSTAVEATGNGSVPEGEDAYLSVYSMRKDDSGTDIQYEDEFRSEEKVLHADEGAAEVASLYSIEYIAPMADAIVKAGFPKIGVDLGEEFPVRLRFGGAKWGVHGVYVLAPRINTDDGPTAEYEATWGDRFETDEEDA